MSIENKLTTVAENQEKVFEAGKTKEWSDFWDAFQANGTRTNYRDGFYVNSANRSTCGFWGDIFYPKYDIIPDTLNYGFGCFRSKNGDCTVNLEERLNDRGVKLDTSSCTDFTRMFSDAYGVSVVPELDMTGIKSSAYSSTTGYMFYQCKFKTIRKIISGSKTNLYNAFLYCSDLENIVFEGEICYSFSVSSCPRLTHDSLMSIINALKDYSTDTSGTTYSLTMGTTNKNKLTTEELDMITAKGWTYA